MKKLLGGALILGGVVLGVMALRSKTQNTAGLRIAGSMYRQSEVGKLQEAQRYLAHAQGKLNDELTQETTHEASGLTQQQAGALAKVLARRAPDRWVHYSHTGIGAPESL